MSAKSFCINLDRDDFNFSAAQILVANGELEPLSGHNYHLGVMISGELDNCGLLIDFRTVKQFMREVIQTFNHKTIVPMKCPDLLITTDDKQVRIDGFVVTISIPRTHCLLLEIKNTSCECLAELILDRLHAQIASHVAGLTQLSVRVTESAGQSVTATILIARP
jgi:6-pyruvoyl-tetrahydropterin synthase